MTATAHSLRADAGLHQLDLRDLELALLQHLHRRQQRADPVGRLVLLDQLGAALRSRGGDAGLELLAAIVERLDALRHRIAHRGRGVDREHHRESGDGAEEGRDPEDVDAEESGACGGCHHQISKLTILAMMKAPMRHPDQPAAAGDHQALVEEEIGHVVVVDEPDHAEHDERQRADDIGRSLGFRRHRLDLELHLRALAQHVGQVRRASRRGCRRSRAGSRW